MSSTDWNYALTAEAHSMDAPKYRAFISYSHRDSRWASWLHASLEKYRLPKALIGTVTARGEVPKRIAPIFRDRDELPSATDLGTLLNAALADSANQIVICSPQAAKSKWVNEEILAFKRLGREDRIFCLVVGGEPNASDMPGREEEECFPPALRFRLGPDGELGTARTEPIAADARPGKDGKSNASLKLISGLLVVGFDSLRRREQQRRNRRLFAFSCAAMAGMVLTTGLAAAALIARATAQRQTVIAKREAETARQTTAFLVDLFRISDPSEARGNSLTAREVLDKGAARIDMQLAKQPQIQATLMDTLGTVYMGLGLYGQAQPLLEAAAEKRRALPTDERADLALSLSHVGDLLTVRAEYPGAESAYRQAIALQRALPSDKRDDAALARSLFGLGSELDARGRSAEAEQNLRDALALQKRLSLGANEDTARTLDALAWTINERDLNEAIPLLQSAVAMQRALWGNQPYPDYADALNDLGLLLRSKSEYAESERLLRESLAMQRRLLGDKHPHIASSLNNLALVLHLKGDLEGANSTYRQALAMQHELLGEVHPDVALTLFNLAGVMHDSGDLRGAVKATRESLHIYRTLFPGDNPDVARTTNRLGYLLTESGDYSTADAYLQEALKMRKRLFGEAHPEVASSLVNVAIFQVATRNYSDALLSARAAKEMFASALSASNWKTAVAQSVSGAALAGVGKYAEAERELVQAYTLLSQDAAALPDYRTLARRYLAELYRQWGRPAEGARYAAQAVRPASNSLAGADPPAAESQSRR
jgi:tetratricopeptide (TPR) repeat protein